MDARGRTESRDLNRVIGWVLVALVFAWVVTLNVVIAARVGLFSGERLDDDELGNAIWGFLGSALAALGALVAALFTYSYNLRTHELHTRAEKRAKDEAATALLGLLSSTGNADQPPPAAQIAGIVLNLRELDKRDAASGVLEGAIDKGQLTPALTARLLDEYFESDARAEQNEGCRLLASASAGSLTDSDSGLHAWPASLAEWPVGYDDVAQIHILVAIAQTLASEDLDDFWHSQRDFAVVLLMGALRNEHSTSSVKKGAWILLRTLNESLVRRRATRFVAHGRSIAAADVERAVAEMPEGAWTTKVRIADEKIRDQWGLERVDYVISPQRLGS